MTCFWELNIFQPLFHALWAIRKHHNITPTFCPGLHITTSEEKRHFGVIGIIDHKNTIAIFHALVKILGDFLRIRRITTYNMYMYVGTVYACALILFV